MTRPMRAARASVFAIACLALSAAGHVWMSGRPVPLTVLLPGFALAFVLGLIGGRRPRGFPVTATLMLAGEAALHLLFSVGQQTGDTSAGSMPGMSMPGTAMPGMTEASPGVGEAATAAAAVHGAIGMTMVHIVAGLTCAWWLHCGERALFALLRRAVGESVAALIPTVWPCVSPVAGMPSNLPSADRHRAEPAYPAPLVHVIVRRGPPIAAGAR